MKGTYRIRITSKRLQYDFELRRKYTVIKGDSATGKTTLYSLIRDAERKHKGVVLSSRVPVVSANCLGGWWDIVLPTISNSIVVIDEDSDWVRSEAFAALAMKSDNYFIFINRDPLKQIPYSVKEIYEIKTSGRYHSLVPIYKHTPHEMAPDYIITEDAESRYQFFKYVCDKHPEACVSADGKSNIYRMLLDAPYNDSNVLVVADGAAFGCDVERITRLKMFQDRKVKLFLPESFEHLLLRSALFCRRKDVSEILGNPSEYIDTSFNSWEQYFTDLLVRLTSRTPAHYTKGKLPNCFIEDCCYIGNPCSLLVHDKKVESVLQLVHDVDFSKLRR